MEEQLKKLIEEIMYKLAYYEYNGHYSSSSYFDEKRSYRCMLAPLITLAKDVGLDLSDIKVSYCGWEYNATEFADHKELTKYW